MVRGFTRRSVRHELVACVSLLAPAVAAASPFSATKLQTTTVHSAAWMGNSSSVYGRAINGNSFESSAIVTFGGYEFVAYWQNVNNAGRVALARRTVGAATWQTFTLSGSSLTNGPNDAHNVVSLGINPSDGTMHIAYDMHGHTLKYRVSNQNAATSATWNSSLFSAAQQNWLVNSSSSITGVTYPMFVQTPGNNLQFFYRNGSSGNGSWFAYDYSGATHTWSNGRQIDDGTVGTYFGTVTNGDGNRNNYPNGFTYDANGRLHSVFTWREGATGAANHDLMYVYSDDGGNVWRNNAGTVVANAATGMKFNLNSPGLIVRALDESQTLMNQQGQNVDHANQIHSLGWRRDPAKDPSTSTSTPWEPQESSYYHNWRDDLGNWHETKLPGNVGARPKIFFDGDDNAFAVYQVASGGGSLTGGIGANLYITNGDLVIAAASKESNWTDWKVLHVETGNFASEAQADDARLASDGILSVKMQASPTTTGNAGTALRVYDFSLTFADPTIEMASADGLFSTDATWANGSAPAGNSIIKINSGRAVTVDSLVNTLDQRVLVGTGGSTGTLRVVEGGTLDLLHAGLLPNSEFGGSIVIGADANSVGIYEQTGGTVTAWRFALGDYATTTSGGGASTATVSGGNLTTYNLDVGFSANGSSSGSTFTQAGGSVNVIGEVILGEFGNAATLNLTGGTFTVAGNIREGFNGSNTSTLTLDGGELDMTNARIDVDNLQLKSGRLKNVAGMRSGTIVRNSPGTLSFAGTNSFANAIQIDAGVVRAESTSALGSTVGSTSIGGGTTTGRLELTGNIALSEPLTLGGRQPTGEAATAPHVLNVSGSNLLNANLTMAIGGNQYNVQSDAGTLSVNGILINTLGSGPTDVRLLNLSGDGEGYWNSTISDSTAGGANAAETALTKRGNGIWRLLGANTYTGATTVEAGTLELGAISRNVLTNAGGLDVRGGAVDFLYLLSASPAADLVQRLDDGYAVSFASGSIRSSTASAQRGLGWRDDGAGRFRIQSALYGDANLSGAVDFNDLLALAQSYGSTTGGTWVRGDFNYDGAVDFNDLLALARNYGSSAASSFDADWVLARSLVPEPGACVLLLAVLGSSRGRRPTA